MGKLALVIAVLALGGAGWAVYQSERARPADDGDALAGIDVRLASIERGLAELKARPTPSAPLEAAPPTPTVPPAAGSGSPTAGPRLTPPARARASVEDRLAVLEKLLEDARSEAPPPAEMVDGVERQFLGAMPGFWTGVEDAAKALKLDGVQKSRLEGIVESTQRDLDDLYSRPNEDGVRWKDVNADLKIDGSEPGELMTKMGEYMKKSAKFKNGKVPGTSETYDQAESRIRKDGKDRARSLLDADQAKVWDKSQPDMLFDGPGGGGLFGSSVTIVAPPVIELQGR